MMSQKTLFSLSTLTLLLTPIITFASHVADHPADQSQEQRDAMFDFSLADLLNITVTSQKREQSVQDVSLSVTALSGEEIEAGNADYFMKIGQFVPGLKMARSGYDARPSMRGARTQQVEHNDVAIAVYHDGVYRSRHGQTMTSFVDVNRVEVMRGPQGTLFGRNSFGGAINVISKKPQLEQQYFDFSATVGDYNHRQIKAVGNFSLSDDSAFRLSALRAKRDPLVTNNANPDAGIMDRNTTLIRGQYLVNFSEHSSLLVKLEHWREDSNGYGNWSYKALGIPLDLNTNLANPAYDLYPRLGRDDVCGGNCGLIGAGLDIRQTQGFDSTFAIDDDPHVVNWDVKPTLDISENTAVIEFNTELSFADLKVLAARMDYSDYRYEDADFSPYSSVDEGYDMQTDSSTMEIQLTSNNEGKWEWVVGLYYLEEDLQYAFLWKDLTDLVDNIPDPMTPAKNAWASWLNQISMNTTSYAAYAQTRYFISEQTRLVAGLRYTEDSRHWDIHGQNPDNLQTLNFSELEVDNANKGWDAINWKLGLEHSLSPDSLLYASASTGFLAGNAQGAYSGDQSYDEQTVTAYEMGSKNMYLDGNLRMNLALYYNQYEDLLATGFKTSANGTTLAYVANAGAIDALGLEVEIDWLATKALQIGFKGELSKARYGDFVTSNPYPNGGQTIGGIDNLFQLDGQQVMHSPDYAFSLSASYKIPLSNGGELIPSVIVYTTDDYRNSDEPYAYSTQKGYTSLDANLTWRSADQTWQVKAYIANLTDQDIKIRATRFGGNVAMADFEDPRTMGIEVSYQF